jgi:hypothetical protein
MPIEPDQRERVRDLLKACGRSYAQDAGIRVAGQPAPLYRLLVLATPRSAQISAALPSESGQRARRCPHLAGPQHLHGETGK